MDKNGTVIIVNVQARRLLWLIKSFLFCFIFVFFCIFLSICYRTCCRIIELISRLCRTRKAKEAYSYIRFNNYEITENQIKRLAPHHTLMKKQTISLARDKYPAISLFLDRSFCDINISKPWEIKREFVRGIRREKEIERIGREWTPTATILLQRVRRFLY